MDNSEKLFLLINSLSKSEKRYFKLFAAKSGVREAKHSVTLFSAIEKQISRRSKKRHLYNEGEIIKRVKGTIAANQLATVKIYLYNLILKSLHLFHCEVSEALKEQLHHIKILHSKNLHDQSYELILKGKKNAKKFNLDELLLEFLNWEKSMMHTIELPEKSKIDLLQGILSEEKEIVARVGRVRLYRNLGFQLLTAPYKSDAIRKKATQSILKKLNPNTIHIAKKRAEGFNEQFYRSKAFELFYSKNENHLRSYRLTKVIVQLLEKNPEQINFSPIKYIGSLNNHLLNCRRLKKYKELNEGILTMQSFSLTLNESNTFLKVFIFQSAGIFELKLYIDTGRFNEALNVLHKIILGFQKFEKKISELFMLMFYYNFSLVYFGLGDFKSALFWNNKEFSAPALKNHERNHRMLIIFNIIVHYELKNFDLIISIIRSLYRTAEAIKFFNEYELKLLDIFNSLAIKNNQFVSQTSILEFINTAKSELQKISKRKPSLASKPPDFDYIAWFDSKIQNRTYAKIIQEKSINA